MTPTEDKNLYHVESNMEVVPGRLGGIMILHPTYGTGVTPSNLTHPTVEVV